MAGMKHAFRTTFRSAGILLATFLYAHSLALDAKEAPPEALRIERLANLCRMWGAVKYFHPQLAYRDVDWDAALMAAIPKVRSAVTRAEYAAAVQGVVDRLGDPVTHVIEPAGRARAADHSMPISTRTREGVLVIN